LKGSYSAPPSTGVCGGGWCWRAITKDHALWKRLMQPGQQQLGMRMVYARSIVRGECPSCTSSESRDESVWLRRACPPPPHTCFESIVRARRTRPSGIIGEGTIACFRVLPSWISPEHAWGWTYSHALHSKHCTRARHSMTGCGGSLIISKAPRCARCVDVSQGSNDYKLQCLGKVCT
jgi:hypothetical protein